MSILEVQLLDDEFTANSNDTLDLGATSLAAWPSTSDVFSPVVQSATIDLLQSVNWPALINSVDVNDLAQTVNSAGTRYTIADPESGVTVRFIGTDMSLGSFFGYTILGTGTVTGFKVLLNGAIIASGSGYDLTASEIQGYALQSAEEGNASPLFAMWFSIPTTVSGTAAIIKSSLALLEPYVNTTAIVITDGPLTVSVAKFDKYENALNDVTGGFQISDTVADVKAALVASDALASDYANISSLILTDGATTRLKLTTAQDTADADLLAKISGDAIIAVEDTSGDWTITGEGNGLTIHDVIGVDSITGGGRRETFVFSANWGTATISDFAAHDSGAGHDTVTLQLADFAQGATTLQADATAGAGGIVITTGANKLTLSGLTETEFTAAITNQDFKFV